MAEQTGAEAAATAALAGVGGYVTVTERLGNGRPDMCWSASTSLGLSFPMVDGVQLKDLDKDDPLFDADDIEGYGFTRDEALRDLVAGLSRLTFAHLMNAEWDEERNRPAWTHAEVAWNGSMLAFIHDGVMPASGGESS